MSTRISYLLQHMLRSVKKPSFQQNIPRSLVADRNRRPTAIAVYYRVEEISRFKFLPHYLLRTTMASPATDQDTTITPPACVRGMMTLDKSQFSRRVSLPALKVPSKHINTFTKSLRVALLKMQRVKPVAELASDDPLHKSHKLFLLDPKRFKTIDDFSAEEKEKLTEFGVDAEELSYFDLEVGYENWGVPEILRAVLPETSDGVSSYSIIGHIAHLNLKPEVLDYKHLIGEVILDKNSSVRTVVNKVNTIDNTYRNFQMELLAGEDNLVTRAKENGFVFEMDFSKVYWNPRLSTEHERVVKLLQPGDVLYDVFAGVGPFAIPAAKKGITVLANDLNPHSYSALTSNITLNKVKANRLQAHNLDGREFILTVLKPDLMTRLKARAEACGSVCEHTDSSACPEGTGTDSSTVGLQAEKMAGTQTEKESRDINSGETVSLKDNSNKPQESSQHSSLSSSSGSRDSQKLYITMNLPALAPEFLDAFCGLLSDFPAECQSMLSVVSSLPTVMCYCFEQTNDGGESDVRSRAEKIMGCSLPGGARVRSVRNVAPGKEMMCLEFQLTPGIVFGAVSKGPLNCSSDGQNEDDHPPRKKQKLSDSEAEEESKR